MVKFRIDREGLRVFDLSGRDCDLTFLEYRVFTIFVDNPGRAYTRDMLLDKAWFGKTVCDRSPDAPIRSLRKKVPGFRECLHTVYAFGWRYDPPTGGGSGT